jgi:hypothetical protein
LCKFHEKVEKRPLLLLDNTDVKRYHGDIKIIKEELKMAVSFNGKHLAKFIRPEQQALGKKAEAVAET